MIELSNSCLLWKADSTHSQNFSKFNIVYWIGRTVSVEMLLHVILILSALNGVAYVNLMVSEIPSEPDINSTYVDKSLK